MPPAILIDHELCTVCSKCVRSCPAEILVREKRTKPQKSLIKITDPNECFECRACEVVCPENCIIVMGVDYTPPMLAAP